ncbi:MAG: SAM-dependent methyltransferase [Sulfurovaceae bacterium]|nr:SAM-dependent methyltransferase [Sulfurovaceae bacterium]
MNEWLYGDDGYYTSFKNIGKEGDFYTAVSSSRFFGASIANFLLKLISQDESKANGVLVEIGAHRGYLICDMIQWIYTVNPTLIQTLRFAIIEKHPRLIEEQKAYIYSRFGDDVKVEHFGSISEIKTNYAFVVSNEIFDAFGCELYMDGKIATVENDVISWIPAPNDMIELGKKHHLTKGEIAVGYEEFASEFKNLPKCDFVSFDYGEKYIRNDFSIRIYKEHKTYPLFDENIKLKDFFGNSDITYDVNFAHVIEAFEANSFHLKTFETQARALISFGIIDILEQFARIATQERYISEADKIKTLISPTIMGDKFKMIHLSKD